MPRKRRIEPFLLVITDRDRGLFNVIGPMTDDTVWINRVCEAQRQKRQVNCQTAPEDNNRETVIALIKRQFGLAHTDELLV